MIPMWRISCQRAIDRPIWRATDEAAAIGRRLAKLHRVLRMHAEDLKETVEGQGDAMNVRLYRQCIACLRQAISEDTDRLAAVRACLGEPGPDLGASAAESGSRP